MLLLPFVAAAVAAAGCCVVAALLLLVLVLVCVCGAALLLRFGKVLRYFRLCSLSLRPLLSSCQVHSSAQRVAYMR